jgi:hypothetical protein
MSGFTNADGCAQIVSPVVATVAAPGETRSSRALVDLDQGNGNIVIAEVSTFCRRALQAGLLFWNKSRLINELLMRIVRMNPSGMGRFMETKFPS